MNTVLQWILILLGFVLVAGLIFLRIKNILNAKDSKDHPNLMNQPPKEEGLIGQNEITIDGEPKAKEEIAKEQTEQQKLLERLGELRKERYDLKRRQNSYALLKDLSGAIQEMLGLEKVSFSQESEFCRQMEAIAQNWSVGYKIDCRQVSPEPEPFSKEIEEADVEELKRLIRKEEKQRCIPAIDWPWDALIDELLPCLEKLMNSAQNLNATDCRYQLEKIGERLKAYSINPVWYHDEIVRTHPDLEQDYVPTQAYAIPALFLHIDEEYIRIGAYGYFVDPTKTN